jgi:hypothetical protein
MAVAIAIQLGTLGIGHQVILSPLCSLSISMLR